jgi:carbon-monoxide dehydrogenase catalytic subunit
MHDPEAASINQDARAMIIRALEENIETVWDRLAAQQPQCGYCSLGLSCRNCAMGPCRVDPFGDGPQKGVCGADADVIVSRNLGRTIAAGASRKPPTGRRRAMRFATRTSSRLWPESTVSPSTIDR